MKNFLKKALGGVALGLLVLTLGQPALGTIPQAKATGSTYGSAALNADPQDFVVLAVSNYSRCPGSNSCWAPSISNVQPGDIVAFRFYVHNTGSQIANNTRVSLGLSGSGSQLYGRGTAVADNAPAVWDDIRVNFANGASASDLEFVGGEYYANSSVDPTNPDSFPNGSSARQLASGGTINIGNLQNDYAGEYTKDVQIVVRYRVGEGDDTETCDRTAATLEVTPSSDRVDVDETADYRAIYDSNGSCSGGETDVTNRASWTVESTRIASNLGNGRFRGEREGNTTVRATYQGLSDTATLRVIDDGGNGGSCDGNETLVIVPYQASFGVGQTYQYRALYDADGPGCSGSERDVTDSASWSSNSTILANLNGGRFRGQAAGTAGITARYSGMTATGIANVSGNGTVITQPPVVIGGGTITLPPTVIGGGTVVRNTQTVGTITSGVTAESVACITVTPSVDVTSMLPGQDFVYTTLYRNDCPFALNSAVLRVFIPNDVEFKASSNPFFLREGQKFSYNIGTLPPGGQGSVAISGMVRKDSRIGDTETFTSSIEFTDSNARIQGTTSYLVAVLGGDIRRTLSASLSDTLGHIFGSAWLWILIVLLVIAGIVWFIVSMIMRRRNEAAATSKVVVAPAEDPLRALRNA